MTYAEIGSTTVARQPEAIHPVGERNRSAVGLGDLAGEDATDVVAFGLGREERDEEVRRRGETRSLVLDSDLYAVLDD